MYYVKSETPIVPADEMIPPPLIIWGPGDPRPTLPIAGWDPGSGTFPEVPDPPPPLDFWGPNDPRPTVPIAEPPWGWGNVPPPIDPPLPPGVNYKYIWTPATGWITVIIPSGPVVTPSKKK